MDQEETPRQDPDLDIVVIFPIERPYERTSASERLDALRGMPYGERVSHWEEPLDITWQTLQDARRLDQERFKISLEELDDKFDRVNHRFDAIDDKFSLLRKTLIIGFISLGGIGVAGTAIIVTLLIALSGGK